MQLNWFSPLPPDRTGIADFTAALAPLLRGRVAVRFVREGTELAEAEAFPDATALASLRLEDVNRADLNVYNIGNHPGFHGDIWRISRANPGIVILHEFRLQHLFHGIFLEQRRDRAGYVSLMREIYGDEGEAAASLVASRRVSPGDVCELFPLVEAAVRGAAGVVVHSDLARDAVLTRTGVPVAKLDLPYTRWGAALPSRTPANGEVRPPLNLVAFGHIGPNRRLESVLKALATLDSALAVNLHVIGTVDGERALRERAHQLGVSPSLYLHGPLPDDALDMHLAQADLAINLRWPTMGEASQSQLRAWSLGVPTVATCTGWYAELPADAVIRIAPEREVEEIAAVIRRCADEPASLAAIGDRGRAVLARRHAPHAYVEGLLRFGEQVAGTTVAVQRELASRVCGTLLPLGPDAAELAVASSARALHGFVA